jgi:hypothetical protein
MATRPIATSGIIQPPLHAVAVASIVARLGDQGLRFAERAYTCLVDQNAYIRRRRTVEGGLAVLVHPWETGLDNSPAWDHPLAAVPADLSLFDTYTGAMWPTPAPESGRLIRITRATSG